MSFVYVSFSASLFILVVDGDNNSEDGVMRTYYL